MADYKEMYLDLLHASEEAVRILIKAQQVAEERYINATEAPFVLLPNGEK